MESVVKWYGATIISDQGDIASWYGRCLSIREARKNALVAVRGRRPEWKKLRVLKVGIHKFGPRKRVN